MRVEWYMDVRVAYCTLVIHRLENILPSPLISSADPGGMQGERKTEGREKGQRRGRGKYTIKFMSNPKVFRLQLSYIPDSRESRKVAEFKTSHLKPKGQRYVLRNLFDEITTFVNEITIKWNLGVELGILMHLKLHYIADLRPEESVQFDFAHTLMTWDELVLNLLEETFSLCCH